MKSSTKVSRRGLLAMLYTSIALLAAGCASSEAGQRDRQNAATTTAASPTDNGHQAWSERLVDGPSKPEDLIALPGTDFLVVSGMSADPGKEGGGAGHLYLMDKTSEELTEIWPERDHSIELDEELYKDCPAPPEPGIASPHGIGLQPQDDGSSRLFVVNHGGRESVEVFTLEPSAGKEVKVKWIGCELLPEGTFGNGVVPDPASDGFYVTHYFDPANQMAGFEAAFAGDNTGYVLHSDPATGWQKVPGSEMSAPNGIALSADGADLYVAGWGSRDVRKFAVGGNNGDPQVLKLDFMPDNLRWTPDDALLVTGQDIDSFKTFQGYLTGQVEPRPGYQVMKIDPEKFAAQEIASGTSKGFASPTTAIQVDGDILIGSVNGDKIMRLSRP